MTIKENKQWAVLNLRISIDMLEQFDEAVTNRVGINRTGLILEAIDEKIKEEKKNYISQ